MAGAAALLSRRQAGTATTTAVPKAVCQLMMQAAMVLPQGQEAAPEVALVAPTLAAICSAVRQLEQSTSSSLSGGASKARQAQTPMHAAMTLLQQLDQHWGPAAVELAREAKFLLRLRLLCHQGEWAAHLLRQAAAPVLMLLRPVV